MAAQAAAQQPPAGFGGGFSTSAFNPAPFSSGGAPFSSGGAAPYSGGAPFSSGGAAPFSTGAFGPGPGLGGPTTSFPSSGGSALVPAPAPPYPAQPPAFAPSGYPAHESHEDRPADPAPRRRRGSRSSREGAVMNGYASATPSASSVSGYSRGSQQGPPALSPPHMRI